MGPLGVVVVGEFARTECELALLVLATLHARGDARAPRWAWLSILEPFVRTRLFASRARGVAEVVRSRTLTEKIRVGKCRDYGVSRAEALWKRRKRGLAEEAKKSPSKKGLRDEFSFPTGWRRDSCSRHEHNDAAPVAQATCAGIVELGDAALVATVTTASLLGLAPRGGGEVVRDATSARRAGARIAADVFLLLLLLLLLGGGEGARGLRLVFFSRSLASVWRAQRERERERERYEVPVGRRCAQGTALVRRALETHGGDARRRRWSVGAWFGSFFFHLA